ncbi:MAG TPA: protein-disulfide reductase DsbD domain-containing protein, partial [Geminicoccaceae bacterium]|nr:protein-disulfide reductase DsbD domain-containing protein [Geminicoccaceae bacterium]
MNLRARIVATLALLPVAAPAAANPVATERVEARLVSEVEAVRPGAPFWVALRLRMAEGWHTYWRNPGDSGLPTTIEWTLPEGFEASEIVWP